MTIGNRLLKRGCSFAVVVISIFLSFQLARFMARAHLEIDYQTAGRGQLEIMWSRGSDDPRPRIVASPLSPSGQMAKFAVLNSRITSASMTVSQAPAQGLRIGHIRVRSGLGRVLWTSEAQALVSPQAPAWEVGAEGSLTSRALKVGQQFTLENLSHPWTNLWLQVALEFFGYWIIGLACIWAGWRWLFKNWRAFYPKLQRGWNFLWRGPNVSGPGRGAWGFATANVSLSFLCYFILLGQPIYDTNDDVVMSFMAAGTWNEPSAELVFIHPWYGALVSRLYTHGGDFPWYPVLFVALTAASLLALNYSVLRLDRRKGVVVLSLLATLGIVMPCLSHLQFTIVGGLAMLAGTTLWMSSRMSPFASQRGCISAYSVAAVLCFFGMMVRIESALMVGVIVAPFMLMNLVFELRSSSRGWKATLGYLAFPAFLIGLTAALHFAESSHYSSSKEWRSYFARNKSLSELLAYGRFPYNDYESVYNSLGLTMADYEMIMSFQHVDAKEFSEENLAELVSLCRQAEKDHPERSKASSLLAKVWGGGPQLASELFNAPEFRFLCNVVVIALCCVLHWNRRNTMLLLCLLGGFILMMSYLAFVLNRLPFRVWEVCLAALTWSALILACARSQTLSAPVRTPSTIEDMPAAMRGASLASHQATMLAVLILSGTMLVELFKYVVDERLRITRVEDSEGEIINKFNFWKAQLPDDTIIYDIGDTLRIGNWRPFTPLSKLPRGAYDRYILAGWPNQSPHQRKIIARLGLEGDFFESLTKSNHVFIVSPGETVPLAGGFLALVNYYRVHHNIDITYDTAEQAPGLAKINFGTRLTPDK